MANGDLDAIDRALLRALSEDSRTSAAALAQVVGLTRQAVADRMERLKADGVIRRYTLATDPDRLGLTVRAFIAITLLPACSEKQEGNVLALLRQSPWVQECYRVTGDDYFQARIIAPDIADVRPVGPRPPRHRRRPGHPHHARPGDPLREKRPRLPGASSGCSGGVKPLAGESVCPSDRRPILCAKHICPSLPVILHHRYLNAMTMAPLTSLDIPVGQAVY